MMLKIILMVTFMVLLPAAILTSLPDPQGSAGVVSVMVAAAGGCWAAIQLYQVIIAMMTMIMNLDRLGLVMIGFGQKFFDTPSSSVSIMTMIKMMMLIMIMMP